ALFSQQQAVSAAAELPAPGRDEFSPGIKNYQSVAARAGGMNGVQDVDITVRIFRQRMAIAVLDVGGQFAPIGDPLVLVITLADNQRPFAAFIVRFNEERRYGRGGLKSAARYFRQIWSRLRGAHIVHHFDFG